MITVERTQLPPLSRGCEVKASLTTDTGKRQERIFCYGSTDAEARQRLIEHLKTRGIEVANETTN